MVSPCFLGVSSGVWSLFWGIEGSCVRCDALQFPPTFSPCRERGELRDLCTRLLNEWRTGSPPYVTSCYAGLMRVMLCHVVLQSTAHGDTVSCYGRVWYGVLHCIVAYLRGNHLSNTTCLTHVFFKGGEECSRFK